MSLIAELKNYCDERRKDLMAQAFKKIGETKAEAKLAVVRGGLKEIEELETKISQWEVRES